MSSSKKISRREFLKIAGVGVGALGLPEWISATGTYRSFSHYARILQPDTTIFTEPNPSAPPAMEYWQDAVLPIVGEVPDSGNGQGAWFQLAEVGYVQAENVQPVTYELNDPDEGISRLGSLAVVTVPYAAAHFLPALNSQQLYRYYYSSIHWVNKLIFDREGRAWYRISDDKYPDYERWVRASQMRILTPEELAPISPHIPPEEKFIQVDLGSQSVTAFEYGEPVFNAAASTGDLNANPNYATPTGIFRVGFKRPSQHMLPWDRTFGNYDLPGVPWVCYFTQRAHAIHGAFWHNGFGSPRSHGCVNLKPEDSMWVYRWTTPVVQAHDDMEASEWGGTIVEVVA